MNKEGIERKVVMGFAFGIGIIILVVVYMNKPSSIDPEEVSSSITVEELEEQVQRLKEELGNKENQLEELEKEYEESKDLIELLQNQLIELNVEPVEL